MNLWMLGLILAWSIFMGIAAQRQKGRTGIGWTLVALLCFALLFSGCAVILPPAAGSLYAEIAEWYVLAEGGAAGAHMIAARLTAHLILTFITGTILTAIIVGSLPARGAADRPAPPARDWTGRPVAQSAPPQHRLPCPACAEPVLPAARKCPHCRSDLPAGWADKAFWS